jgi:hypothetical protein
MGIYQCITKLTEIRSVNHPDLQCVSGINDVRNGLLVNPFLQVDLGIRVAFLPVCAHCYNDTIFYLHWYRYRTYIWTLQTSLPLIRQNLTLCTISDPRRVSHVPVSSITSSHFALHLMTGRQTCFLMHSTLLHCANHGDLNVSETT